MLAEMRYIFCTIYHFKFFTVTKRKYTNGMHGGGKCDFFKTRVVEGLVANTRHRPAINRVRNDNSAVFG